MPIAFLGIAVGISFGSVIKDMLAADANDAKSRQIYYDAFKDVEEAAREARTERDKTAQKLLKLSKRKNGIMNSSLTKFVDTFQKVAKINFTQNDLNDFNTQAIIPAEIKDLQKMVNISGMGLNDKQLLSTFVFHGFLKGPLGGISGIIRKESEINLHVAYMNSDMADVATSHNKTAKIAIAAIGDSADRFSKLLANLNALFVRNIGHIDELVNQKGTNKNKYADEDKKDIMSCFNLAETIKKLLEQPLFEPNGVVSQQAIRAMKTGESTFLKLQRAIY